MQAEAKRRWIAGAIAGAERLCLPLPWERGKRRERMLHRRHAAAAARQRPAHLLGTAWSDRTEARTDGRADARIDDARTGARTGAGAAPLAGQDRQTGPAARSGPGAIPGIDDFLTE